jgi:hypothetical protein
METNPETLGVFVKGHFQRAIFMGHGQAAGEMPPELGEGCEKEPRGLPEAVGEGPRAFLLMGGRGKGYPQGGVKVSRRPLPWGTPRIT